MIQWIQGVVRGNMKILLTSVLEQYIFLNWKCIFFPVKWRRLSWFNLFSRYWLRVWVTSCSGCCSWAIISLEMRRPHLTQCELRLQSRDLFCAALTVVRPFIWTPLSTAAHQTLSWLLFPSIPSKKNWPSKICCHSSFAVFVFTIQLPLNEAFAHWLRLEF